VALAFGGYWRAFVSAAVSVSILTLSSAVVFGFDTLPAFLHGIASVTETHLITNAVGVWFALQSVYGLVRCLGGSYALAMGLQLALGALCATGMAMLWRSKVISFPVKAAALCVATLLVTPYVWVCDLPVLSMALAFLYRERIFDRIDWCGIIVAMLLVATFPFVRTLPLLGGSYPVGLLASTLIGWLVLRRVFGAKAVPSRADRGHAELAACVVAPG
jgi:hypothetical protein